MILPSRVSGKFLDRTVLLEPPVALTGRASSGRKLMPAWSLLEPVRDVWPKPPNYTIRPYATLARQAGRLDNKSRVVGMG